MHRLHHFLHVEAERESGLLLGNAEREALSLNINYLYSRDARMYLVCMCNESVIFYYIFYIHSNVQQLLRKLKQTKLFLHNEEGMHHSVFNGGIRLIRL